jgi:hypothetical protein
MGYAKVIWIYEDGLRHAAGRETELAGLLVGTST